MYEYYTERVVYEYSYTVYTVHNTVVCYVDYTILYSTTHVDL